MTAIQFPALAIDNTGIDRLNYKFLVADKNYLDVGYKNSTIVDMAGNCFKLSGIRQKGGISIIDSIKNFGMLVKVEPVLKEPVKLITVEEFKSIVSDMITKHPRKFSNLDSKDALLQRVNACKSHIEVINVF